MAGAGGDLDTKGVDGAVIEPDLPIVDPHHHLGYQYGGRFLVEEFAADVAASGHNVRTSVYIECSVMYRRGGPEAIRPAGEVEFAAGQAAMSESGDFGGARICAGIVGAAELRLGDAVDDVLEAMEALGGGRFRGLRGTANWDADPSVNTGSRPFAPKGLLLDPAFRKGFARLAARGLTYDAWQYYTQLGELCGLADAFPDAAIVVDHCGGLLGIGPYDRQRDFAAWKALIAETAKRPNVHMKLGGLAGRRCGFAFETRATPASAAELADLWRPYIETCIELFGPARCMFESNVQPDYHAGDYRTLWNSFKLIASGCSAAEKTALFSDTARRFYRID
jgi:predicted TIM-barrel fold metal-dependent hydrolase